MALSKNSEILRAIIMQHYDKPLNKVESRDKFLNYLNYHNKSSSCIDDIEVFIDVKDGIIIDAKFYGVGCAISTSSTDIICDLIKNKDLEYVKNLLDNYFKMINNDGEYDEEILDELICMYQIKNQSNRIKCATIGAISLKKIIEES